MLPISREGALVDKGTLICVVEIPKGSRNKYEYEPALETFDRARHAFLDRL